MNILFLTRRFYPSIGGVEKHLNGLCELLLQRGNRVTILTEKHEASLKETDIYKNIKIIRIPQMNKYGIWKWIQENNKLFDESDIIHVHDVFFWVFLYKLTHWYKKIYVTFHGWEGKYPIPINNILIRKISETMSSGNICIGEFISKWYHTNANFITYGAN